MRRFQFSLMQQSLTASKQKTSTHLGKTVAVLLGASFFFVPVVYAHHAESGSISSTKGEKATIKAFNRIKDNPVELFKFLKKFPKGADLHNHVMGAVYAEDYIKWAAEDGLCVSLSKLAILNRSCRSHSQIEQQNVHIVSTGENGPSSDIDAESNGKKPDIVSARYVMSKPALMNRLIDALSMRDFVPTRDDRSGHDHFFSTFERFENSEKGHQGEMLAKVRKQGSDHGVLYLELMVSPNLGDILRSSSNLHLEDVDVSSLDRARRAYAPQLNRMLMKTSKTLDAWERDSDRILGCCTNHPDAACKTHVKYLFQAVRVFPLAQVYAELETGYAIAAKDPRVIGLNFVAPEDNPVALRDYKKHMAIFAYLHKKYPNVQLALHAGEMTQSLVHPDELRSHIDDAVHIAKARRIGHGIDIIHEDHSDKVIKDMAAQRIAVEINLTSNDEILGVKGNEHPFNFYRRAGVPLTLSTDDEGVSRGNMTTEYLRAVTEQHVSYPVLKELSRNGIEYSFVPGRSLWKDKVDGAKVASCPRNYSVDIAPTCASFLANNEKAKMQWELEGRFAQFEAR